MIIGVPVGTHVPWLDCTSSGCPRDVTRTVPLTHCADTQGPFPFGGGGNVQPAIAYGDVKSTVGCPLTRTRGLGTVGLA